MFSQEAIKGDYIFREKKFDAKEALNGSLNIFWSKKLYKMIVWC